MEYRSALTLKPFDTIEIPGIGTKQIGAIEQIRDNRYRIRLEEKFVESIVIDVLTKDDEQRTPEWRESRQPNPSATSVFLAALQEALSHEDPTNAVIQTPLGVGTVALITETLNEAGASWVSMTKHKGIDIEMWIAGESADTLIVHDAGDLDSDVAELVSEVIRERTVNGRALSKLKRVILVYPGYGETLPASAVLTEGSRFRTIELIR